MSNKPFKVAQEIKDIIDKNGLTGKKQNDMGVLISQLADTFKRKGYKEVSKELKKLSENYIYVTYA